MAKKKTKTKKKTPIMSRDQKFLSTLIKYTERNIRHDGTELDLVFQQQADKLRKQLESLK